MSAASQARATGATQIMESGRMIAPITAKMNMPTVKKRKTAPMIRWNFRRPTACGLEVGIGAGGLVAGGYGRWCATVCGWADIGAPLPGVYWVGGGAFREVGADSIRPGELEPSTGVLCPDGGAHCCGTGTVTGAWKGAVTGGGPASGRAVGFCAFDASGGGAGAGTGFMFMAGSA